jgi:hypothetical protein
VGRLGKLRNHVVSIAESKDAGRLPCCGLTPVLTAWLAVEFCGYFALRDLHTWSP